MRVGDGRLGLAQEAQDRYALIVVDAFNSDAVPVHLLTREAIGLYLARLAPGGVLLFNATNDYLDLEGVLGRAAADAGLAALVRCDEEPVSATEDIPFRLPSDWVALARSTPTSPDCPGRRGGVRRGTAPRSAPGPTTAPASSGRSGDSERASAYIPTLSRRSTCTAMSAKCRRSVSPVAARAAASRRDLSSGR